MPGIAPVALSSRNDQLKLLRRLVRQPKARSAERAFVADGPTLVADLLRSPLAVRAIYVGDGAGLTSLEELAADASVAAGLADVPVYTVDESVLTAILDPSSPRPLAAVADIPTWKLDDIEADRPVLVAVELRDPGNIGTLIRSAEAAGCGAVVVVGQSVDHHNPKAVRASAGSVFRIPVLSFSEASTAVSELSELGRPVVATVVRPDARAYEEVDLRAAAILVGNEPHGLALETIALADTAVTIPMAESVESLNVAAAAAILAFEAARQRRTGRSDR